MNNEFARGLAEAIDPSLRDRIILCYEDESGEEVCTWRGEPCEPDPNAISIRLTWADGDYGASDSEGVADE